MSSRKEEEEDESDDDDMSRPRFGHSYYLIILYHIYVVVTSIPAPLLPTHITNTRACARFPSLSLSLSHTHTHTHTTCGGHRGCVNILLFMCPHTRIRVLLCICADTRVCVWAGKIKRRQAGGGAKKGARMDDDSGDDSDRVSQVS